MSRDNPVYREVNINNLVFGERRRTQTNFGEGMVSSENKTGEKGKLFSKPPLSKKNAAQILADLSNQILSPGN